MYKLRVALSLGRGMYIEESIKAPFGNGRVDICYESLIDFKYFPSYFFFETVCEEE